MEVRDSTCGLADRVPLLIKWTQGNTLLSLPGTATLRLLKEDSDWLLNLRSRRTDVDSVLVLDQWTSCLPLQGSWRGHGNLSIQSTCVLWIWTRFMIVCPGVSCKGYCGSMGYQGRRYKSFSPCIARVRTVPLYSAASQTCFLWVLDSPRVATVTDSDFHEHNLKVSSRCGEYWYGDLRIVSALDRVSSSDIQKEMVNGVS